MVDPIGNKQFSHVHDYEWSSIVRIKCPGFQMANDIVSLNEDMPDKEVCMTDDYELSLVFAVLLHIEEVGQQPSYMLPMA